MVLALTQPSSQPDFVFNDPPAGAVTDQVNAFLVGNAVVDFYLQHHPLLESTFTGNPVLVQVDYPGACHNLGGHDGIESVFVYGASSPPGPSCASAAYSSAITHESGLPGRPPAMPGWRCFWFTTYWLTFVGVRTSFTKSEPHPPRH